MRGSMIAREIDLKVKRVYVPTVQDTMVSAPVVIPPVATMNENEEPVLQDPIEPIATYEGSNNSLKQNMCQM